MLLMANVFFLSYLVRILWLLRDEALSRNRILIKAAAIGILLVVSSVQVELISTYSAIGAAVACLAGFHWLINIDEKSSRLARVTRSAHARLLRLSGQRSKISNLASATFRTQVSRNESGEFDLQKLVQEQYRLDRAAGMYRAVPAEHIGITHAAQGSNGGYSEAENAKFGLVVAFSVSFPFMIYELLPFISSLAANLSSYAPLEILVTVVHYLRWVAFGGVFGYFYPAIRGQVPIRKSMALLLTLVPIEFFSVDFAAPAGVVIPALAIKTGFLLFFALSLGLAWEWRLAKAASVHWGRVRDFSRVKSFFVPVSTIVIAGVTALATSLASAAVNEMVQPSPPQNGTSSLPTQPAK